MTTTLQTAVLNTIIAFANTNTPFTIHDITKKIRKDCNDGELDIPEAFNNANTGFKYEIQHDRVKQTFQYVQNTKLIPSDIELKERFDHNIGCRKYTPSKTDSSLLYSPVNVSLANPVPTSTFLPTSKTEIVKRIQNYLLRCEKQGNSPTIRQIQSAIKRGDKSTGYTSSEILSILMELYFTVKMHDSISKSQVVF